MKLVIILSILISSLGYTQTKQAKTYQVVKTEKQWKAVLTPMQYYVLRQGGTEHPFTSKLNKNYKKGIYVCAACKTPLYASKHKFDSGTGWPSFDKAVKGNVQLVADYRNSGATELKCAICGGHLGHIFNDGPKETTGKRHCINGAALIFIAQ
ncbi:peptide-methionine (R)-S-oxide reductase MsrB [Tenacibaculum sp. UWU-22]|uniref:peptide-methionine (R)-S-oxide reductase MsrB n=1 Tax=Tenacibaculum sp. UWU-22 TaxID=3234187 RepID=UPI0034DB6909